MKSSGISIDMVSLYKSAASPLTKRALSFNTDSLKNGLEDLKGKFNSLSPGAKTALISALGGAGVGLTAHLMTPKDEDEDRRGRLLTNLLTGAALGGLAGYGGKTLYDAAKSGGLAPAIGGGSEKPKDDKGWYQRNAPEVGYSDLAIMGGLGTGAVAGGAALNSLRINEGLSRLGADSATAENAIRNILTPSGQWNEAAIGRSAQLTRARNAFNAATNVSLKEKLKQLIPNWSFLPSSIRNAGNTARRTQANLDRRLMQALESAAPGMRGPGMRASRQRLEAILRSTLSNPRKIMQALQTRGVPKGRLGLIAAALLAGGTGYKLYNAGRD